MNKTAQRILLFGAIFMALSVMLGAFGAHALKENLTAKAFETYKTGVTYQFYHALGLLILGLIQMNLSHIDFNKVFRLLVVGILLFSFNCYLYALTSIKIVAMIIPIGGVSFIAGWSLLAYYLTKR